MTIAGESVWNARGRPTKKRGSTYAQPKTRLFALALGHKLLSDYCPANACTSDMRFATETQRVKYLSVSSVVIV